MGTWLGETVYAGSTNAHRLLPETTQTAPGGGDVRRKAGDCLYCHASHRGQGTHDSLRGAYRPSTASTVASDQANGTYAAACFSCHGGVRPSGFATTPVDIKQFVTSGQPRAGHRIETSGGVLPVGAPLPCYECHNPHGSTPGKRVAHLGRSWVKASNTSTTVSVRRFCLSCHTTSDTGAGWDSESGHLHGRRRYRDGRGDLEGRRSARAAVCHRAPAGRHHLVRRVSRRQLRCWRQQRPQSGRRRHARSHLADNHVLLRRRMPRRIAQPQHGPRALRWARQREP